MKRLMKTGLPGRLSCAVNVTELYSCVDFGDIDAVDFLKVVPNVKFRHPVTNVYTHTIAKLSRVRLPRLTAWERDTARDCWAAHCPVLPVSRTSCTGIFSVAGRIALQTTLSSLL